MPDADAPAADVSPGDGPAPHVGPADSSAPDVGPADAGNDSVDVPGRHLRFHFIVTCATVVFKQVSVCQTG